MNNNTWRGIIPFTALSQREPNPCKSVSDRICFATSMGVKGCVEPSYILWIWFSILEIPNAQIICKFVRKSVKDGSLLALHLNFWVSVKQTDPIVLTRKHYKCLFEFGNTFTFFIKHRSVFLWFESILNILNAFQNRSSEPDLSMLILRFLFRNTANMNIDYVDLSSWD